MDAGYFRRIAPRCGGQAESFEELCCQIARRTLPDNATFVRLYGAGGDGGVECFADLSDGSRIGWQAKFVFDIEALIKQVSRSLDAAFTLHKDLTRYVVCFPFDPTGPTARRGKSGVAKLEEWTRKRESAARKADRRLMIDLWSGSRLLSELFTVDVTGGMRAYFFNETILSQDWFAKHLSHIRETAGPRYTPELHVETDLWKWLCALGQTDTWTNAFQTQLAGWDNAFAQLAEAVKRNTGSPLQPPWPDSQRSEGEACVATLAEARRTCTMLFDRPSRDGAESLNTQLSLALRDLAPLETRLADDLDVAHGSGRSDSPSFRQFMAEYECSFPAANLDDVRETMTATLHFLEWLRSPAGWPAFESAFLLLGVAGSGKTHGVCDAAVKRLNHGQLSVAAFGHEFRGDPDPWTRLRESLGLPTSLDREALLDTLNSAGEASGHPLVIFLDAINETKPLSYWRDRLSSFAGAVQTRPFLRLCATCRTSYEPHCTPDRCSIYKAAHEGFAGIERLACETFFAHYDLEPPVTPILQPELSNPLYLRLVCETLKSQGSRRMPSGWRGIAPTISAFLREKDRRFALDHERAAGASRVSGALLAIAERIASSGGHALPWSDAETLVRERDPAAASENVLDWLITEDLVIEDAPPPDDIGGESSLRPAFERLGDFLIARELLSRLSSTELAPSCRGDGCLGAFLGSVDVIESQHGVVSALSVLIPEDAAQGTELPDILPDGPIRTAALKVAVASYPWRDPSSFSAATESNLREALTIDGFANAATDATLATSWAPSAIDAVWFHGFLGSGPMAVRDAFWCGYLHDRFEKLGPVRRLIDAAFDLPLKQLDVAVAERWATILLWFTAAADRRVKDLATRAATTVLETHTSVVPEVLSRMLAVDDDAVRERTLLAAYAACIRSRDPQHVAAVCSVLIKSIACDPESFDNALLRDHGRSIAELARKLGEEESYASVAAILDSLESSWPLDIPEDEQVNAWEHLPRLVASCCQDDFFVYSLGCLDRWASTIARTDMGKWILKRIADDFGYAGSGCERYDRYMLRSYGFGRGKPIWPERIGKKYQWIAMHQLAAHLADHVEPQRQSSWPELLREPLILLQERQIDPTLPTNIAKEHADGDAWWIPASVDLDVSAQLSDQAWAAGEDDVPDLRGLLTPFCADGADWRLLAAYMSWTRREDDKPANVPYRQTWAHVESYLVPPVASARAFACLKGRNFFGRWLPEGASWLYGFAGEYPWGAAFNTEPEEWHSMGGRTDRLPCAFLPAWSQLAVEWEYDASLPRSFHINVPARLFFEPGALWWNHRDGFEILGGRTVFRDPSATELGPSALIGDMDDLAERLQWLNRRLLWTLIGQKWVLGGSPDRARVGRTFSQVALLNADGALEFGPLAFFDDYEQATGPALSTSIKRACGTPPKHSSKRPKPITRKTPKTGRRPRRKR